MPPARVWTEEAIIRAVHQFYVQYQRWPTRLDFLGSHPGLPSLALVMRRMRTWEDAVRHAKQEDSTPCP